MTNQASKAPGADCSTCPGLTSSLVSPEPASAGRTRLIVVGEGSGWNEVREGRPFSPNGVSGRTLERVLKIHCGLKREEIHWTNAILCDVRERDQAKARKCCQRRLTEELAELGADTVLAVGGFGLQSAGGLSRKPAIMRFRGAVIEPSDPTRSPEKGAVGKIVIGTVHPASVAHSPLWDPIFQADVARVGRVMRDGFVAPEKLGRIVVAQSYEHLQELLPQLAHEVVVDIETIEQSGKNTGKPDIHTNHLTCFVIADTELSVVIPWSRTKSGLGLYFNGRSPDVIKLVNETFAPRIVTTHNGPAYDHLGLMRRGFVIHEWDDTLLAYHAITSCFPKSLEHVSTCYIDVPPWKKWPHDVSLEELWRYCGRDGLYTARTKRALFATMDDSDRVVYEHDKGNAALCTEMSRNGFLFDLSRAKELSAWLKGREEQLAREAADLTETPDLNVLSVKQLWVAMRKLGAYVCYKTDSGAPSLGKDTLRAYAASANSKLADAALKVIEYRSARKTRSTYIDRIRVHEDGRVRPTWLSYGTLSGRWSAQGPNLANLPSARLDPTIEMGGIRSLYVVAPGRKLVTFDICLRPNERLLKADLTWVPIKDIKVGDELIGFDEHLGKDAKMRKSVVEATKTLIKSCLRIVTDRGTVECSQEHMWVVRPAGNGGKGKRRQWVSAKDIRPGDRISYYMEPWEVDRSYEGGYIAGFLDGEGYITAQRSRPTRLTNKADSIWEGTKTWSGSRRSRPATVLRVDGIGKQSVVAVQTSTHTFIAEGFMSHNCQAEFRIAAYWSGDPVMIASCAPGEDVHTANAKRLFGPAFTLADKGARKSMRDLSKKSVFAACYLAEALTVLNALLAEGKTITLLEVEEMLQTVRALWDVYYRKQAESLDLTIRRGYVESPIIGRKRWLGFTPSPPENANFPIQAGAADAMNLKLQKICRLRTERGLDAKLVAMVYDAAMFDTAENDVDAMRTLQQEVFDEPVEISGRSFVLPIDRKVGTRWSEV